MMTTTVSRTSRWTGWLLVLVGAAVLAGYVAIDFYKDGQMPTWEKFAVLAVVVGGGLLLLSVLIERLRDYKTDKYKDIER